MEEYHTPTAPLRQDEEERGGEDDNGENDETGEDGEEDEMDLIIQQMYATSLSDRGSCSSLSSLEEVAETLPPSPLVQDNDTCQ